MGCRRYEKIMKAVVFTLGCKVNQYETQAMEQLLVQSGHTLGSFDEICDGYIINTCTVTAVSDKKSRNAIRRVRKLNPAAAVGVCGCYAQSSPDEIRKLDVDVLMKATKVDGVYDSDPRTNPDAKKFDRISYDEVLARHLAVMDTTATSLAMDNSIPVIVFALAQPENIRRTLSGEALGTTVS